METIKTHVLTGHSKADIVVANSLKASTKRTAVGIFNSTSGKLEFNFLILGSGSDIPEAQLQETKEIMFETEVVNIFKESFVDMYDILVMSNIYVNRAEAIRYWKATGAYIPAFWNEYNPANGIRIYIYKT